MNHNQIASNILEVNNRRDVAFDYLKAFAIWLVVYGHCHQHLLSLDRHDNIVYVFIYSFHMPLFMCISGYFSSSSLKMDFIPFLKKKGKGLLLPVFTYSLLLTIFYLFFGSHGYHGVVDITELFLGRCWAQHWFFKALFLCYLLLYCSRYFAFKKAYFIITIILSQFIHDFNMPIMYPVFLVGYFIRKEDFINKYKSIFKTLMYYFGFVFLLLSSIWCIVIYPSINHTWGV